MKEGEKNMQMWQLTMPLIQTQCFQSCSCDAGFWSSPALTHLFLNHVCWCGLEQKPANPMSVEQHWTNPINSAISTCSKPCCWS
jgi:hypothetical protein